MWCPLAAPHPEPLPLVPLPTVLRRTDGSPVTTDERLVTKLLSRSAAVTEVG